MIRPDPAQVTPRPHRHKWQWYHEWWGAHVCTVANCYAVRESPPVDPLDPRAVNHIEATEAALATALALLGALVDALDNANIAWGEEPESDKAHEDARAFLGERDDD